MPATRPGILAMSPPFVSGQETITPVEYEFLSLYLRLDEDRRAILRLVAQAFLEAQTKTQQAA